MTAEPNAQVRFRRAIERRALWMAEDAGTGGTAEHAKPSMSLDVYTHVMPVAEVAPERISAVLV